VLLAEVLAGAFLGFLIAALGGGGGLLAVPLLVFAFREPVAKATGTSLAIVFAASVAAVGGHWRKRTIRLDATLWFGGASMIGACAGARLHACVSERFALTAYAILLFAVSLRMITRASPPATEGHRAGHALVGLGFGVGLVAGFLGVGGGVLIVPSLIYAAGLTMSEAVGTSVAIIAMTSSSGAVSHVLQGNVSARITLAMGGGAMVGAVLGAPLAGRLPEKPVRLTFAALVVCAAAYTLWRVSAAQ
jgi:uncharacterized membrane protein YfcA